MTTTLIDSHCHPHDEPGEGKPAWLSRAVDAGVAECIAVGTDRDDWHRFRDLATAFPQNIHWTIGLHPSYVGPDFATHLQELPAFLGDREKKRPCAVGEIGLDFTRLPKEGRRDCIELQERAFRQQLVIARDLQLPVVIHSRGTVDECLAIIHETAFPPEQAIFHCFSEGPETLARIRATGAKCSFTGIVTFKNAQNVREAMRSNGLENLILETDSPYLSPEPYRGQKNEPARTAALADFCADFFQTSRETIARISRRNTTEFFRLLSASTSDPSNE